MNHEAIHNGDELLQKKAESFRTLTRVVHIPYKNGSWKRGTILSVHADFFILSERLEGEMPVFFLEMLGYSMADELRNAGSEPQA